MASYSSMLVLLLAFFITQRSLAVHAEAKLQAAEPKETYLRFYMHYEVGSAVTVVNGPANNPIFFGDIIVADMAVTEGPSLNSTCLGRAQGFYIPASQSEYAVLLNLNIVFVEGPNKGSTISVFGRDVAESTVRELSVVGGTGSFRMAQGYVHLATCEQTLRGEILDVSAFLLHF